MRCIHQPHDVQSHRYARLTVFMQVNSRESAGEQYVSAMKRSAHSTCRTSAAVAPNLKAANKFGAMLSDKSDRVVVIYSAVLNTMLHKVCGFYGVDRVAKRDGVEPMALFTLESGSETRVKGDRTYA